MTAAGFDPTRSADPVGPLHTRSFAAAATTVLAVLTAWSICYELADTAVPALQHAIVFQGIAPDVAFVIAAVLLIARGAGKNRGWMLIGLGALCWAAGDVYWTLNLASSNNPPVPSWADAGYLSFCPLAFLGILALVRGRISRTPKTLAADACAAALAVASVSAAVVIEPILAHADGGILATVTNLAYPVVDLLLLGLIVGATALGNWRLERTWVLLGASVIVFWVADSVYLVTVATETYQQSAWFNPLWYAAPIIAAWAAWLPHHGVQRQSDRATGVRGIVMPLTFACIALGVLVCSSFWPVGPVAVALAATSLLVIMGRLALTWRENAALLRASQQEALTDALTQLGNRRALLNELNRRAVSADPRQPYMLALFDLDGFKHYNDEFGHPTGDTLLQRLGHNLELYITGKGTAYRMGGDEFCALLDGRYASRSFAQAASATLCEAGEGFAVGCSYGAVLLPSETQSPEDALRVADQRMYARKRSGRASASRQSKDVLLRALAERSPELGTHLRDVADLAAATAHSFELSPDEVEEIRQAAELHDVGKVAIPDAILHKSGPLTDNEWEFIRRHTLIGERIIAAAPALHRVAALVRSSHENFDGTGYPDKLAGGDIPIGSRIIAVCDAFHAMTTDRHYRQAMDEPAAISELRRCAGGQFDPAVIDRFCEALLTRVSSLEAA
jgi:diguanylate cyclase (GGDEF)-like protein